MLMQQFTDPFPTPPAPRPPAPPVPSPPDLQPAPHDAPRDAPHDAPRDAPHDAPRDATPGATVSPWAWAAAVIFGQPNAYRLVRAFFLGLIGLASVFLGALRACRG
jgi:hypothetical protein